MTNKEYLLGVALLVALITMSLSLVAQGFSAMQTTKAFSNTGTLKKIGVGIYTNSLCNNPVSSLSWGLIEPNCNQYLTAYVKNEGNSPTTISLHSSNWNPLNAESYVSITWNYDGEILDPEESIRVTFILTVSPNVEEISTFNFDVIIVGTG